MSSATTRPVGRYGEPGPRRRRVRGVVLALVLAGLVVWTVWAGIGLATHRVDPQVQGYDVVDDTTVLVTFSLTKSADLVVECRVEALSSTSTRVGWKTVRFGPEGGASSVHTVQVRTQQRAVTGVVQGCAAV